MIHFDVLCSSKGGYDDDMGNLRCVVAASIERRVMTKKAAHEMQKVTKSSAGTRTHPGFACRDAGLVDARISLGGWCYRYDGRVAAPASCRLDDDGEPRSYVHRSAINRACPLAVPVV